MLEREEITQTSSKEVTFTYSTEDLAYFTSGNGVSFKVNLSSQANVSNSHQDLLYDFDSSSDVQIKVQYKYRLK